MLSGSSFCGVVASLRRGVALGVTSASPGRRTLDVRMFVRGARPSEVDLCVILLGTALSAASGGTGSEASPIGKTGSDACVLQLLAQTMPRGCLRSAAEQPCWKVQRPQHFCHILDRQIRTVFCGIARRAGRVPSCMLSPHVQIPP